MEHFLSLSINCKPFLEMRKVGSDASDYGKEINFLQLLKESLGDWHDSSCY